jgi:hypothetical protein
MLSGLLPLPACRPAENSVICPTDAAAATLTPQTPNTTGAHAIHTSDHHRRAALRP